MFDAIQNSSENFEAFLEMGYRAAAALYS